MIVSIGRNTQAAEKLRNYLDRIERLFDEIDGLKDDLKDVKSQARDEGFNVAALVRLVAIRRDKRKASHENELLNDLVLYAHATGMPLDIAVVEDDPVMSGLGASADGHQPATLSPAAAAGE
jgi:uncharacterized protein (UPF0335 family)